MLIAVVTWCKDVSIPLLLCAQTLMSVLFSHRWIFCALLFLAISLATHTHKKTKKSFYPSRFLKFKEQSKGNYNCDSQINSLFSLITLFSFLFSLIYFCFPFTFLFYLFPVSAYLVLVSAVLFSLLFSLVYSHLLFSFASAVAIPTIMAVGEQNQQGLVL